VATRAEADVTQLRELLKLFNELPPKVKREARSALRHTGDQIIAGQRSILDGPLPAGVAVEGKRTTLALNKKTGRYYVRQINNFVDRDVQRGGRSSGLREGIKSALVTRVVTGTTRQGIEVRTQNGKGAMSTGWNAKRFRHPVFGNKSAAWVYQAGQPYFFAPVFKGRAELIENAIQILNNALEGR